MDEYIKRDALLNQLDERLKALRKANGPWDHYTDGFEDAAEMVEYFDPADAVEVRHGEWTYGADDTMKCSRCRKRVKKIYYARYCPVCGAKMDGKGEGE